MLLRRTLNVRALAVSLLLVAQPATAATIVLDFEEQPVAAFEDNSFLSIECGCVRFSDLGPEKEVHVVDGVGWPSYYRHESRAVLAGSQGGTLMMEFLVPVVELSFDFVNFFDAYDVWLNDAVLTAYAGDEIVGVATLPPAPNGPRFQTISISPGTVIERAVFEKYDLGEHYPFSPIVDNIVLTTVPEPTTLGLLGLTLAGAAARSTVWRGSSRQLA
jgi:hypothetical protein